MNAIATQDNEKPDIRAKLESAVEKAKDACERLEEMLAIWVFVVLSFAALVFAGYVIWAKCSSPSPF